MEDLTMAGTERWLLSDLVRVLRGRGKAVDEAVPEVAPLEQLIAGCEVLMSGIGEPAMRAVAATALNAYGALESPRNDDVKTQFFRHLLDTYGVEAERVREAYAAWDRASHGVQAGAAADAGGDAGADTAADAGASAAELAELFSVVEPRRQELLRRMNHAPGATVRLVEMRADLRRLMRIHPDLIPLDRDFRHVFASWFNRGFLRMEQVGWDAPRELLEALLRFEKVHPMSGRTELRRRLQPKDRRCYAFFHPATGDIPLIFVEVALTRECRTASDLCWPPGPR